MFSRGRAAVRALAGDAVRWVWETGGDVGAVRSGSRRADRFGAFGDGSQLRFPQGALYNERYIRIGRGTLVGPGAGLAVGMSPGQEMLTDTVLTIGDRCLIGRDSHIVAHFDVVIGDDVVTGPGVYVTDQNHAYDDLDRPIGAQSALERPVRIGSGSWLGTGCVILPGVSVGNHVTVAANAVVTHDVPDRCVVAGAPARIVRRHVDGEWRRVRPEGVPDSAIRSGDGPG